MQMPDLGDQLYDDNVAVLTAEAQETYAETSSFSITVYRLVKGLWVKTVLIMASRPPSISVAPVTLFLIGITSLSAAISRVSPLIPSTSSPFPHLSHAHTHS